jgi:YXWGXW repeat-containing protein
MLKLLSKRVHLMLFAGLLGFTPLLASADVSITVAPPVIPIYDQPPCPGDGYLWIPGYWSYGEEDYYWVPGVWVLPPEVGFLWTPGWWGWGNGGYFWHAGYWGPHVGFYGGINYGFGYFGTGFWGGHWEGGHFFYNTAAWHVGAGIHNTYVNHSWAEEHNRVSFNGPGGIERKPTAEEERAGHEGHRELTEAQRAHEQEAIHDHAQKFSENKGNPGKTALTKTTHETLTKTTRVTEHHGTAEHHGTTEHHATAEHHTTEHHTAEHHTTTQHHTTSKAPEHHASASKKSGGDKKK